MNYNFEKMQQHFNENWSMMDDDFFKQLFQNISSNSAEKFASNFHNDGRVAKNIKPLFCRRILEYEKGSFILDIFTF